MTRIRVTVLGTVSLGALVLFVLAIRGVVNNTRPPKEASRTSASVANDGSTPADARILAAEGLIKQAAAKPDGYNLLAAAYMQKIRETGDFGLNSRAEAALDRSLELERDNYDALKLRSKLLLSYHRFREGLEVARRAQSLRPDDHDVYGAITDAQVELGNYADAIEAAQKMMDLRPDSSSYARVAYLRSLHGDIEGAIEAMRVAVKSANPNEPESVAWCRVQLGNELMNAGKRVEAEREYDNALLIFPGHRLALDAKAHARLAAGDLESAIQIYEREQANGPSADTALALGDLYAHLEREEEATRQYQMFEALEPGNAAGENSWHHMINYWLDHDKNLTEALTLAKQEYDVRKDVFTCDTLAWAFFKNGRLSEASGLMKEALRLGTRDARILYHAGAIYYELGDRRNAAKNLVLALEISPVFDVRQATKARQLLETLKIRLAPKT